MSVLPEPSVDHENLERLHQSVVVELDRQLRLTQRHSAKPADKAEDAHPTELTATDAVGDGTGPVPGVEPRIRDVAAIVSGQGAAPADDIHADVLMTVEAIERAGTYVQALQEQVSRHQDAIALRDTAIGELRQEKDAVLRELARSEDVARATAERAMMTETRLREADASRQVAEQQVGELQAHVRTLMAAVGRSLHLDKASGRPPFKPTQR